MQQINHEGRDTILALFEYSWGEVDWILPVLFKLKELKPEWCIIAIFSASWNYVNQKIYGSLTNYALESELNKIADDIVYLDQTKNSIPGIKPEQVRIILRDYNLDTPFKLSIQKFFPFAKVVMYPTSTTLLIPQRHNNSRNYNIWEKAYLRHDLALCHTHSTMAFYFDSISNLRYSVVGFPRYDQWWIERLLNQDLMDSAEAKSAVSASRVFVFFSLHIAPDYVVRSIAEVVLNDQRNFLFIKPHPRQSASELASFFAGFDSSRWRITSLQAIQLADISDFVITSYSSCAMDALCVGKPVVEFFPFVELFQNFVVNQNGQFRTPFQSLGLTVSIDTKDQLATYIHNFFDDAEKDSCWNQQQEEFRKICPSDDHASLRAAEVILNLVEPDSTKEDGLPLIQQACTSITNTGHIFLKKESVRDQAVLHFQLKRIKAYGMPISSVLLRELAQAFGAEIFVTTGTFSEHLTGEAAKIFSEVHTIELASDLYQAVNMPEVTPFKNIHIYHSANLLQTILPNLNGKILFWLSTHEAAGITTSDKTNTPIIEELRVIRECNKKDSIILINNMRYFQPIKMEPLDLTNRIRKYPGVQQAVNAILEIDPAYQIAILGDIAVAYPSGSPVTVSPAVQACTLSRLFDGSNLDFISVLEAENMIAFGLSESEKEAIQFLHKDYVSLEEPGVGGHYRFWNGLTLFGEQCYAEAKEEFVKAIQLNCNHWQVKWFLSESAHRAGDASLAKKDYALYEKSGVSGYYRFWNGLTLFGEQRYIEAKGEFIKAMQLNCNHWRVAWFLAESAHKSGDIALTKQVLQALTEAVPNFKPAQMLLKQIESIKTQ